MADNKKKKLTMAEEFLSRTEVKTTEIDQPAKTMAEKFLAATSAPEAPKPEPLKEPGTGFFEDPAAAAKFGTQKLLGLTARIAKQFPSLKKMPGPVGAALTLSEKAAESEALQPPKDFTPKATGDQLISFVIQEAPVAVLGGPALKAGRGAAALTGLASSKAKRSLALRVANRAVQGGTATGILGGAGTAMRQAQEGRFDPVELAQESAIAFGLGAAINPVFAPIGKQIKKVIKSKKARFQEAFEPGAVKAKVVSASDVKAAKKLDRKLAKVEATIAQDTKRVESKLISPKDKPALELKVAKNIRKRAVLEEQFRDVMQGPAFKALQDAKNAFGKKTFKVAGREVPLFEQTLSPRGVVVSPEEMSTLMDAADIGRFASGQLGTTDFLRMVQQSEGKFRGVLRRLLVDPADDAIRVWRQNDTALRNAFSKKVQELGIDKSAARQKLLFRVAENTATDAEKATISGQERQFINWTKNMYSKLLDEINKSNAIAGLPTVNKRKNYVTHLQELNFFQRMGLKPGSEKALEDVTSPFARKIKSSFRFEKERMGGAFKENLIDAVEAYIGPATRRIYMQRPASVIQARAKFLPPNLRKATNEWVETALLGGVDQSDKALVEMGLEPVLNATEVLSSAVTRGVIGNSLRVAVQQPSQIVATGALTGVRPMVKGLAQAFVNPPTKLMRASNFLTGRTIRDELIPVKSTALRKFDKFAGAIIEYMDRYVARASWYAGFDKAKKIGLSDAASVRYADDIARMLHASYQQHLKPQLLRGRKGRAFLPFQSFAFNYWNLLTKDPRVLAELNNSSRLKETLKLIAATVATNQIYDAIGLPAPFAFDIPKEPTPGAVAKAAKETTGTVPIVGGLRFGIPSPAIEFAKQEFDGVVDPGGFNKSIFGNLMVSLFSDDEEKARKALERAVKSGARLIPSGNQVYNMIHGVKAARDGYYTVGHEEVDVKGLDKLTSILLGPTATRKVREEFERREIERLNKKLGRE